jgi:Tfp pilus assembly protein FimV
MLIQFLTAPNMVGAYDAGGGTYVLQFADGTERAATAEEIAAAQVLEDAYAAEQADKPAARAEIKPLIQTMQAIIDAQQAVIDSMQLIIDAQPDAITTMDAIIAGVDASSNAQLRTMVKDIARELKDKAQEVRNIARDGKSHAQEVKDIARAIKRTIRVVT